MTEELRRRLENEVATLKPILEDLSDPNLKIGQFWKLHQDVVPAWAECAKRFLLLQPSSAAIERVWSMFSNFFDPGSENSPLMDYICAFLMLRYNYRSKEGNSICSNE